MPGGTNVGRVYYDVDAENNVSKGLAAAEGEAQAFTQSVSAMEAIIEVDADLSQLKKDAAEAQAIKEAMEAEKIEIDIKVKDLRKMKRDMKEAGQDVRRVSGELTAAENAQGRFARAIEHTNAALKENKSLRTSRTDERRRIMDVVKAEEQNARSIDKSTDSLAKQEFQVAKLVDRYVKLHAARKNADKGVRGLHSAADRARLGVIDKEMALIRERAGLLGRDKDHFDALDRSLARNSASFTKWGQSISQARIHLGFMSTTVGGLARLMVVFGPIVAGVLGALGSLISVVGAGISGAFAVGGAALTGFGLAAVGVGFALREPIHQLGVAWKASTAYADAVQKYGKDSTQAADKQDQLNNAIKGLPPQAQKAVKQLGGMRQEFMKLGGDRIRGDFFNSFAEGIKTASALLPTFARGSAKVFGAVSKGFNDWMKGLRGAEAQNILGDIFQGAADLVPGLMKGLGSLGSTLGRIFQAASKFEGSLGDGFAKWAQGIEDSVGSGDQLTQRVGRWIDSMRKVGHFAQSATSALVTFFGIGVGPGGDFLDSMTRSLDRWNNEMKRNPDAVRNFFQQGVDMMKQLGPAVGRALGLLLKVSVQLEPLITGISAGLNILVDAFSKIPAPILTAMGALLAFNKVFTGLGRLLAGGALARGLGGILGGFGGRGAARSAGRGGAMMEAMFGGAGAAGTTSGLARVAAALGVTGGAAAAMGAAFTVAAVGIGIAAHNLLNNKNNTEQANDAMQKLMSSNRALPMAQKRVAQTTDDITKAQNEANKAQKAGDNKGFIQHMREVARLNNENVDNQQRVQFEIHKQEDGLADLNKQYEKQKQVVEDTGRTNGKTSEEYVYQKKVLEGIAAQQRLAGLNINRMKEGAKQVGAGFLKSMQAIKTIAGRQTALKFRFDDEGVVENIGRISQKVKQLGGGKQAIKILTDTGSAESKLKRLLALARQLEAHRAKIKADVDDNATPKLKSINAAMHDIPESKKPKVTAQDAASAVISSINSLLGGLHDKTINIHANYSSSGTLGNGNPHGRAGGLNFAGAMNVPGYAAGGMTRDKMDRAMVEASKRQALNFTDKGGKLTQPRFIAGEQAPRYNEFVITENPAFRVANLKWLAMAASGLGAAVIPAFAAGAHSAKKKKGNKKGNKNKGGGGGGDVSSVDTTAYDNAHDSLNYWSQEYDLDRRSYDSGVGTGGLVPGFDLNALVGDLTNQLTAYDHISAAIGTIQGLKTKDPQTLKKAKMARLKKQANKTDKKGKPTAAAKSAQAQLDALAKTNEDRSSYNDDLKGQKKDLGDELKDIPFLKQALQLDILELRNAATSNTLAGTESANSARLAVFRDFASNIVGGITVPKLARSGLGSASTVPALTGIGPGATMAARSAMPSAPGADVSGINGGSGVTISQTFAAPPPDPHTYAQSVAFEIGAATA